jgi:hypothetical protein
LRRCFGFIATILVLRSQVLGAQVTTAPVRHDSVRRIAVTPAHLASAFRDSAARAMLSRARSARLLQDAELRNYEARAYQRVSTGLSVRETGRNHLVRRAEEATRIRWQRGAGVVVDMTGKRTAPLSNEIDPASPSASTLPIPYYPGRETVWIGGSLARVEVDERQLVHPLAEGSEAYYVYGTGDSISFALPDGARILLRELRVEAREPKWNLIVGSFWVDVASAQVVRAVYRMSTEIDAFAVSAEEHARDPAEEAAPWWAKALLSPVKGSIDLISIESSLFMGRFWLPARQALEGRVQVSFVRIPVVLEERYEYPVINGDIDLASEFREAAPPLLPARNLQQVRDSIALASGIGDRRRVNRLADSVVEAQLASRRDSIRDERRRMCRSPDETFTRRDLRADGTLDVLTHIPCDELKLLNSADLPDNPGDVPEPLFTQKEREAFVETLGMSLQARWHPQPITVAWGFGQSRYNRVEGFSTGLTLREELGRGLAWSLSIRGGQGDRQVNGEFGLGRGDGRVTYKASVYRRLASVSDWGDPLTFGASLPALVYGRDDHFYYRASGAEISRLVSAGGHLTARVFVEREWTAPVTTRFSIFHGRHDPRFGENIGALEGTYAGVSARWRQHWGSEPGQWQMSADVRGEVASGATDYGRAAVDLGASHPIFTPITGSLTVAAGSSLGTVSAQRAWLLGGVETVRGQDAGTVRGDAFWFTRTELGMDLRGRRMAVFADVGWAGDRRSDWGRSTRPASGVGFGTSLFGGLFRFDAAHGVWPKDQRRSYFTLESRF